MLGTLVVIVEHPLSTFDVLAEHGFLFFLTLFSVHIEMNFRFIVEPFGGSLVMRISRSEIFHEVIVVAFYLLFTAHEDFTFFFKALAQQTAGGLIG
jgi:hypothetical protein